MTTYKCPWCWSEDTKLYLKLIDEFLTKEPFEIHVCASCGLLFTEPRPDAAHIGSYYKSENYFSHQENKKGFVPKLYEKVKHVNLKNKYKMTTEGMKAGKMLDIGCGVGDFLKTMEEHQWQVFGIEPDEDAKNIVRKRTKAELYSPSEIVKLQDESFDLITLWHVLEHIEDLNNELNELKRLIKRSGRIVIAVPNYKSYDGQYYKQYWGAYDVPRHLSHFNKQTLSKIFASKGLELKKTEKLVWDAYYVSYLSEQYKKHHLALFRGAFRGWISNCKARRTGEWSSMVYIFEPKKA